MLKFLLKWAKVNNSGRRKKEVGEGRMIMDEGRTGTDQKTHSTIDNGRMWKSSTFDQCKGANVQYL